MSEGYELNLRSLNPACSRDGGYVASYSPPEWAHTMALGCGHPVAAHSLYGCGCRMCEFEAWQAKQAKRVAG
jgi:hypothetical protein